MQRRSILKTIAAANLGANLAANLNAAPSKVWLGPEYWANPLQDWRSTDGRMECHVAGGDRNVFWLTREWKNEGACTMQVRLGGLDGTFGAGPGWIGFRFGMRGFFHDYRDTAIRGLGHDAGVTSDGRLFIGIPTAGAPTVARMNDIVLRLEVKGEVIRLSAGEQEISASLSHTETAGGVALVCHSGPLPSEPPQRDTHPRGPGAGKPDQNRGGTMRGWFRDWSMTGTKVAEHPERAWGPILFVQYTVSLGVLKMTVQLAPCEDNAGSAELHIDGRRAADAAVEILSSTATFRVASWDDRRDRKFEVVWQGHRYAGIIQRDPKTKPSLVAAALTCQWDFGFPHQQIATNLEHLNPDILFFTGDQLYESNGGYGIQRSPVHVARLDYLRKWYLFGWAWGDLTRRIPCVCLADDHDVYHGNLWGAGGRKAEYPLKPAEGMNPQQAAQDSGGFSMDARWVNLVYRTQSSHLPGSAQTIDQSITAHYGELVWGGVSFALLEDRKFKSAPKSLLPEARIVNGWPQNPSWDSSKSSDVAGAQLLGAKQEEFLRAWARNWPVGVEMKAVVSATIFCNLATLPAPATNDAVTNKLPILDEGGYAPNERLTQDHDSNGWPQTPRNRALRTMRSCLAVHIAGDQHLPSTLQYGVDEFDDASFAICTPAVSNFFPRRWFPPSGKTTGKFIDGFGNRVTVRALANPHKVTRGDLHVDERAPGFGVVVFDKRSRKVQMTNWPRWVDLRGKDVFPYPGWPVVIAPEDNGLRSAGYRLTLAKPAGGVIEVKDSVGETVLCWRAPKPLTMIHVWKPGLYRVTAGGKLIGRFDAIPVGVKPAG